MASFFIELNACLRHLKYGYVIHYRNGIQICPELDRIGRLIRTIANTKFSNDLMNDKFFLNKLLKFFLKRNHNCVIKGYMMEHKTEFMQFLANNEIPKKYLRQMSNLPIVKIDGTESNEMKDILRVYEI